MIPLNNSAVNVLRKYVPQLGARKLWRFENLQSLGHQLYHEKFLPLSFRIEIASRSKEEALKTLLKSGSLTIVIPDYNKKQAMIEQIYSEKREIISPVQKQFDLAYKLLISRRQFGLQQGNLLQIPHSLNGAWRYLKSYFKYHFNQLWIVPCLQFHKLKFSFLKKFKFQT
ncbi:hypothetical protein GF337_01610 [candidate division KSB1 bacterium]|nr:hypothetical protein [candidate division KSB1 bacterium]